MLILNLFGDFRFGTGYLEMQCLYHLCDLELGNLFDNTVIEQVYSL